MKNVFVSHSHDDRKIATELNKVLKQHSAKTFLDREQIVASQSLPKRIREGISSCDVFLLVWSRNAARSKYVTKEWNTAYDMRKKILPCLLDAAPLPNVLDNLVYVTLDDAEVGYGKLLKGVFGRAYTGVSPGGIQHLIPGTYRIDIQMWGGISIGSIMEVELTSDRQITGSHSWLLFSQSVVGKWSVDNKSSVLILEIVTSGVPGLSDAWRETIRVNYREGRGPIRGVDNVGRGYTLQRVS